MNHYYTSIIIIILLALFVLSVLVLENDRMPKMKKRIFMATNILIALAAIGEYVGVLIGGNKAVPHGVIYAAKAVDYTLTPMTGGALIMLMQKQIKKSRLLLSILLGNAVVQVIAAFGGWMVVVDDQNHYTHGRLYPIYTVLYLLIILILMLKMLEYGKIFESRTESLSMRS